MADVPGAMSAITAGDCKSAGATINDGLQRDDAQAYFLAGFLYDRTGCVSRDPARAIRLYRRASVLGDQDAPIYLGLLYGLGRGVPQDYARAHRAFGGEDTPDGATVTDPPNAPNAPNAIMLGYLETVSHLVERQIAYPTIENTNGLEATLDVVLEPATGRVTFARVKVDIAVGSNLARSRAFTDPLEEGYRSAIATAPKPVVDTAAAATYSIPWKFRMRRGPDHEKVRLEGYVTVGSASAVL